MTGWRTICTGVFFFCWIAFICSGLVQAQSLDDDLFNDGLVENFNNISDPLEPINRAFFKFNDKLYFWVLKPVSKTYAAVLPEDIRMCIGNAFNNLLAPVRIVNNLLQGKVADSGTELARFFINTLAGAGGLADPAKDIFNLNPKTEDLGQTFGKWGIGEGIYICWPVLGPSNVRDTVGFVGDYFLNPLTYLTMSNERAGLGAQAGQKVNSTSLSLGDYEQFIEATFDPYTAMRDFYYQSRRSKIADKVRKGEGFSKIEDPASILSNSWQNDTGEFEERKTNEPSGEQRESLMTDLNNVERMIGHGYFPGKLGSLDASAFAAQEISGTGAVANARGLFAGLSSKRNAERL